MKSSALFSTALMMAIAQAAEQFGLVIIRSGSDIQNAPLKLDGDKVVAGSSTAPDLVGEWQPDSTVKVNGKFLGADPVSDLGLVDTTDAIFSDSDGYLAYGGSQSFTAVPGDYGVYWIRIGSFPGAVSTPVALKIVPMGNSTTSPVNGTATTTQINTNIETSTVVETGPCPTCTVQQSAPCATCPPVETGAGSEPAPPQDSAAASGPAQVNGAISKAVSGFAAVAGVAAALF